MAIVPVILCGGAGTRLWPASRQDAPKPFLPLVDGRSTFALTLERVADRTLFAPPVVMAAAIHRRPVEAALAGAGTDATLLLEPEGRDTAAAIAAVTAFVKARDANAVLLILPADHVIADTAAFRGAVETALAAAEAGRIAVFGIAPTHPATGFGYIRPGAAIAGTGARAVAAFVEKPDVARAAALVAEGCVWNSGMFLFAAATMEAELNRHAPAISGAAAAAVAGATTAGAATTLAASFRDAPKLSIDYAVMEKTDRAAVVAATFDWSDLGTWSAVWEAAKKDRDGNVVTGDAVLVDARNAYVASDGQRLGVVGIDDAVVVAGNGAVLVTTRARAGEVKNLVAAIDARPEAVIGDFVRHYRPWGHYQSLDVGPRHQVKRIVVEPGARLSLQRHKHRAEHWTVVEGVAEVTVGMSRDTLTVTSVAQGAHVHIPQGAIHRLANRGGAVLTLIEVQVGDYLGEDDIERLEDDYGRGS